MNRSLLTRAVGLVSLLALGLAAAPASSQTPGAPMPPGHPPVGADPEQPALPEGHPPISGPVMPAPPLPEGAEDPSQLPPGHPPISGAAPGGMPPGMPGGMAAPRGSPLFDDASLPAGSLVLQVRDGRGQVVGGLELTLEITRKTIAEGETRSRQTAKLDAQGQARFDGLKPGSEWIYQTRAKYGPVAYHSPQFQLGPSSGKRVTMLVYEATEDMDAALVGIQTFLAFEPREEFLQVEHMLNFANVGERTWVIPAFLVPIQSGYQAFQGNQDGSDIRIDEVEGAGFRVSGFVRPGVHELSFRYQIPYQSSEALRLDVSMPPRVAQVRILAAAIGSTRMRVEGMPEPMVSRGTEGQRLLVTERSVPSGGEQIDSVTVHIHGLPTPGSARWYAVLLASAAVLTGLVIAFRHKRAPEGTVDPELLGDIERAKKQLLDELAQLETARKSGEVGPKTYEHARRTMLESLSRLIAMTKPPAPPEQAT